jgi:hypothetical protein
MTPLIVGAATLNDARHFFENRGSFGCEGTAMVARASETGATRLVVPDQRAGTAPSCWVEVTDTGKLELAAALAADERYVARIHSHPMDAFHSATDDKNPAVTFLGAISVVVPYFGLGLRHGLDACAVLHLTTNGWIDVPPGAARDALVVVG